MELDIFWNILLFVVSLAVLVRASDWFVDAAEAIGLSLGLSPFIIGITIVAFGTSLPELATSVAAVLQDNSEVVLGTVLGSNITNIGLVLGLAAVFAKMIDLEYNIWHIDMPYLWGSAFLLWFVLQDGQVDLIEALLLLGGIAIFLVYSMKSEDNDGEERPKAGWRSYLLVVVAGVLVWLSAKFTIQAIEKLSELAQISPEIISLSAVALGTSLPEVVVSLSAARKGKASIAVGNVLGSNVFNTYIVVGIPALIGPLTITDNVLNLYLPIMIALTILFGVMANNKQISRWEGTLLLLFYAYFMYELIKGAL